VGTYAGCFSTINLLVFLLKGPAVFGTGLAFTVTTFNRL